jgi:hypothetical protein
MSFMVTRWFALVFPQATGFADGPRHGISRIFIATDSADCTDPFLLIRKKPRDPRNPRQILP